MRSQGFRSTAGVLPAMVMFMAVNVVVGCRGEQRRQTNSTRAKVEQAECPHDAIVIKVIDSTGNLVKTVDTIPLSGPVTKIPEFHDCQRFIQHVNRYDSVYAIFAAFRLESLPARLKGARDSAESDGKAYRTVPVATIYSYGGEYDPLGIKPGFNCLFLYRKGAQWGAKMIPWSGPVANAVDTERQDQGMVRRAGTRGVNRGGGDPTSECGARVPDSSPGARAAQQTVESQRCEMLLW